MICTQSASCEQGAPVATTSSTPASSSAIAAKRYATPSRAAWRRSAAVVSNVRPRDRAASRSGSQPGERSPPRNGSNVRPWSSRARTRARRPKSPSVSPEPGVEVAPVGERAALDDAARVEPVEEEAGPRPRPLGLVERSGARPRCRPSAQRGAGRCSRRRRSRRRRRRAREPDACAARPRAAAGARCVEPSAREQLGVPAAAAEVEQAGAARRARCSPRARRRAARSSR